MEKQIQQVRARQTKFSIPLKKSSFLAIIIFLICCLFTFNSQAQNRPDITTLDVDAGLNTTQEQDELACLIQTYLNANDNFIHNHTSTPDDIQLLTCCHGTDS